MADSFFDSNDLSGGGTKVKKGGKVPKDELIQRKAARTRNASRRQLLSASVLNRIIRGDGKSKDAEIVPISEEHDAMFISTVNDAANGICDKVLAGACSAALADGNHKDGVARPQGRHVLRAIQAYGPLAPLLENLKGINMVWKSGKGKHVLYVGGAAARRHFCKIPSGVSGMSIEDTKSRKGERVKGYNSACGKYSCLKFEGKSKGTVAGCQMLAQLAVCIAKGMLDECAQKDKRAGHALLRGMTMVGGAPGGWWATCCGSRPSGVLMRQRLKGKVYKIAATATNAERLEARKNENVQIKGKERPKHSDVPQVKRRGGDSKSAEAVAAGKKSGKKGAAALKRKRDAKKAAGQRLAKSRKA